MNIKDIFTHKIDGFEAKVINGFRVDSIGDEQDDGSISFGMKLDDGRWINFYWNSKKSTIKNCPSGNMLHNKGKELTISGAYIKWRDDKFYIGSAKFTTFCQNGSQRSLQIVSKKNSIGDGTTNTKPQTTYSKGNVGEPESLVELGNYFQSMFPKWNSEDWRAMAISCYIGGKTAPGLADLEDLSGVASKRGQQATMDNVDDIPY